jgi:hypothetical protein
VELTSQEVAILLNGQVMYQDNLYDLIQEEANQLSLDRQHEDNPFHALRDRIRKLSELSQRLDTSESLVRRLQDRLNCHP